MRTIEFTRTYVANEIIVAVAKITPGNDNELYWLVKWDDPKHPGRRTSTSPRQNWQDVRSIYDRKLSAGLNPTVEEHHCAMFA